MKKFFKYISLVLAFVVISLYSLDGLYTYIYQNGTAINKVAWVKLMKNTDSLDYVFLGSSRCIHHIMPKLIQERTGKKGLNLGHPACSSFEVKLMLNELLRKRPVKRVFIQVDDISFDQKKSVIGKMPWLPFIKEEHVYKEFYEHDKGAYIYRYVPFYRYQIGDSQIGYRTVAAVLAGRKVKGISEGGYIPAYGELNGGKEYKCSLANYSDKKLDEIQALCDRENIALTFFTSPIYKHTGSHEAFHKEHKSYYNFVNSITDPKLFMDQTHLNGPGAEAFTNMLIDTFFVDQ